MEYRIEKKPAFKVMGVSKIIDYGNGYSTIPKFWDEVFASPDNKIMGVYGVCLDDEIQGDQFRYMIADDYNENLAIENGYEVKRFRHTPGLCFHAVELCHRLCRALIRRSSTNGFLPAVMR